MSNPCQWLRKLLLFYCLTGLVFLARWPTTTATAIAEEEGRQRDILALQEELVESRSLESPTARTDRHETIQATIDAQMVEEADRLRRKFRDTPRPNDRLETLSSSVMMEKPLHVGDPLWFLVEIPQWWVTATVVDILEPEDDDDDDDDDERRQPSQQQQQQQQ